MILNQNKSRTIVRCTRRSRTQILDLVLSNYRLKDFGAIEALGLLEKSGVVVPFIIFSDTLHSSDYNEAFRAGASSIISWEDIDGLNAIINQELGLRPVGLSAADQFFEALRESENWYQTIFDHIHDGIAILKYGKVEYVSDRALEIFGCTRESYEQYIGFDFAVPEERSYLLQLLVEIRQKDIFQDDLEFWIIAQDGTRRCVHNRFSIIHRGDEDSYQLVIMTDITHRKKTEQALRVSEERHRIISDLVSDYAYSFRIEPDGTYKPEWLTDAFTRITGFSTPEEIDSFAGLLSLIHMEDQSLASRYGERIMSGEPTVSEFRIVAKNGEVRWIRDYSLPVWDDRKGRVVRLFGAAQDITQRKAVQEALEQSEIRNKAILEASPDWVFHVSRTGIILDYKPGRERDLFKSLNISPGNKLKEVFPQELVEVIQEHIRKTFENKDVQVFEFKMSFPDGERHFEASMVSASQQGGTDDELAEYWHHLRSELDRQRSLIERLLTVGRLETGSLKLNPVPLNILPKWKKQCHQFTQWQL